MLLNEEKCRHVIDGHSAEKDIHLWYLRRPEGKDVDGRRASVGCCPGDAQVQIGGPVSRTAVLQSRYAVQGASGDEEDEEDEDKPSPASDGVSQLLQVSDTFRKARRVAEGGEV